MKISAIPGSEIFECLLLLFFLFCTLKLQLQIWFSQKSWTIYAVFHGAKLIASFRTCFTLCVCVGVNIYVVWSNWIGQNESLVFRSHIVDITFGKHVSSLVADYSLSVSKLSSVKYTYIFANKIYGGIKNTGYSKNQSTTIIVVSNSLVSIL